MIAKRTSAIAGVSPQTASKLLGTRATVLNAVPAGGVISVGGRHNVSSGATAQPLHPQTRYLILETVDREDKEGIPTPDTDSPIRITRTNDSRIFTIEPLNGMSTLRDILDHGYRRVDEEIITQDHGMRGLVNVTIERYRRYMARIEILRESISGFRLEHYGDDYAYICGDRCIVRKPELLFNALRMLGFDVNATPMNDYFRLQGVGLDTRRGNVRISNIRLNHLYTRDIYTVLTLQVEALRGLSNIMGVDFKWDSDSRIAKFRVFRTEASLIEDAMAVMDKFVNGYDVGELLYKAIDVVATHAQNNLGYSITQFNIDDDPHDYDQFDTIIVAWTHYWNTVLRLTEDNMAIYPDIVKAIMVNETGLGRGSSWYASFDLMTIGHPRDPAMNTLARINRGAESFQHPNDFRIRADGYGAIQNLFVDGSFDRREITPTISICFGIRWLAHHIQNAAGRGDNNPLYAGVSRYNGGGLRGVMERNHRVSGDPYLNSVLWIMECPENARNYAENGWGGTHQYWNR